MKRYTPGNLYQPNVEDSAERPQHGTYSLSQAW
jgi:hypothetical protein